MIARAKLLYLRDDYKKDLKDCVWSEDLVNFVCTQGKLDVIDLLITCLEGDYVPEKDSNRLLEMLEEDSERQYTIGNLYKHVKRDAGHKLLEKLINETRAKQISRNG